MIRCEKSPVGQEYRRLFVRAHTGPTRAIHNTLHPIGKPCKPPPARGKGEHLSTAARHGPSVRYATTLSPGHSTWLPRGVVSELAVEYGVSKEYPSRLWTKVSKQFAGRQTLEPSTRNNLLDLFFPRPSSLELGGEGWV